MMSQFKTKFVAASSNSPSQGSGNNSSVPNIPALRGFVSEALRYDSDAAAKAVDAGLLEYDSDDNPIVLDRRKIEPFPALDHSSIDYEPFNKDFYEEK
ncbi:DEAD-box ATP-dependent RNA helicase 24-like [Pyrus ussuriensis x Pyrus communis]|uniref:DEAD-box ATP-dependent RNA helicase 24-like n=1 Tax=Pyrus ussuriensis x Pyrus communis TaxID=2448454 RepID=A0A5N5GEV5_9ROSA|nr:DEAD-box ATP-dependent RNA helicase 24-like [Pyrus ussuriensis x Pyrus communis]